MKKQKRSDLLFYTVIIYVLIAGAWWSYLLQIKNEDALSAKKRTLWLKMENKGATEQEYLQSTEYLQLVGSYTGQRWMIFGEGLVLLVLTVIGIWRIAKGRKIEVSLMEQQHNFLLSITHELKSPIASIQLVLETFQRHELSSTQKNRLVGNGLKDAERLHSLVQDMLLAARIEGGYRYTFETLNIVDLLEEAKRIASPKYSGMISLSYSNEENTQIQADKTTMLTVFTNLLENAIKYCSNTPEIAIKVSSKETKVLLNVCDTGPGIPLAQREKVFEKFYRVGGEDTRTTKGTGLGLYIVKQVVQAHGGAIWIEDNVEQGTIFSLSLPKNMV